MATAKRDKNSLFSFGPSGAAQDNHNIAFSLLRAVPFKMRGPKSQRIIHWGENVLAARLFRCPADQLPRTEGELIDRLPIEYQRRRRAALENLTFDGACYSLTYSLALKDEHDVWVRESGQRLKGEAGAPSYVACVIQDVTCAERTKAKIEYDFRYEPITGCLNKTYFSEVLSHQQAGGGRPQIISITIKNQDDLTKVYGAFALDYVFEALAKRISGELSPDDYTAFDQTSHFQILLSGLSAEDILAKSKKFKYILSQIPIESPYGMISPNCSVAVETPPRISADVKDRGSADINLFRSSNNVKTLTEVDLLIAMEQDRFCLAYQPIVTANGHDVAYYEALLRYQDNDGQLQTAFPYIILAERLGQIGRLDRRALQLARRALTLRSDLKLSLNISVGTISDKNMIDAYLSELKSLGSQASNIMIELTETMALDNIDKANQFSAKLQALGCQLAVDDFGAGHTSFKNLLGLEAQIIKIDGSYIRDIALSDQKQNFVRMIAEMAQVFGMKTVAEMIDNEADMRIVERLGVDYLQGFYLGRPDVLS